MNFDHVAAQTFEWNFQREMISRYYPYLYREYVNNKSMQKRGVNATVLSVLWENMFFDMRDQRDLPHITDFLEFVKGKKALDIGCGWYPYPKSIWTVSELAMIDPLLDKFIEAERSLFQTSFFDDAKCYSVKAEELVGELVGTVDGFIHCRNTLDHSADPLKILYNISKYAAKGCYLLLWSDIWHYDGGDVGHKNITQSTEMFDVLLKGLGFKQIVSMRDNPYRKGDIAASVVEYGGIFIKEEDENINIDGNQAGVDTAIGDIEETGCGM